jgi:hypothetical protein
VINYRKQSLNKKRPSDNIKRHIPLMTKLDYSLSNSSEDEEHFDYQFDEGQFID